MGGKNGATGCGADALTSRAPARVSTAPRRMHVKAIVVAGVASLLSSGCLGQDRVVRVLDGQEVEGRYIAPEAYDAFIRGTIAETDGDPGVAAAWYVRAHEYDPAGVEPLARLGSVLCEKRDVPRAHADKVFTRAIEIGPDFGVTYVRRAKCELSRGEPAAAERDARIALSLDPNDGDATVTLADALLAGGKAQEAARVLDAWVWWTNGSRVAWRAVAELASKRKDHTRERVARAHLGDTAPPRADGGRVSGAAREPAWLRMDQAIVRGDLQAARAVAVDAHLRASVVAVRACAMGRWEDAVQQATAILAADPEDADAAAVLLAAPVGAQAGESPAWQQAVSGKGKGQLSALAALLIADALQRRLGAQTAGEFLSAYGQIDDGGGDPLVAALVRRVRANW